MGNIITSEEDISDEEEQNSEILVADGYDDHAPVINIYELLMNNEFMEIQTDRDDWIIYLLSQHDMFMLFMLMLKDDVFYLLEKLVFISSLFFVPYVQCPEGGGVQWFYMESDRGTGFKKTQFWGGHLKCMACK